MSEENKPKDPLAAKIRLAAVAADFKDKLKDAEALGDIADILENGVKEHER